MIEPITAASAARQALSDRDADARRERARVRAASAKLKADLASAKMPVTQARANLSAVRGSADDATRDERIELQRNQKRVTSEKSEAGQDLRAIEMRYGSKLRADRSDAAVQEDNETDLEHAADKAKLNADRAAYATAKRRAEQQGDAEIAAAQADVKSSQAAVRAATADHRADVRAAEQDEKEALTRLRSVFQADAVALATREKAYRAETGGQGSGTAIPAAPAI